MPADCELDPQVIATALTNKAIGLVTSETSDRARWQWQTMYGQLFYWLKYSTDNWCSDVRPGVDTACWTEAGDDRSECLDARAQLEQAAVVGPLCAYWMPWFAGVYFAHHAIEVDPDAFKHMPLDMLCSQQRGLALGCLTDPDHSQRCLYSFQRLREYIDAESESSP